MPHGQKQQTEEQRRVQAERTAYLADLRGVFSSPAGQRVLNAIRARAGADRPSTVVRTGEPVDPYLTHWRDGRRSIVLELLADLAEPEDGDAKGPGAIA